MRFFMGLVLALALGVMGCSEEAPRQCVKDEDCDDQNDCTDDSCVERYSCCLDGEYYGTCRNRAVGWGQCDFDGLDDALGGFDGICFAGVCRENPCDDGNECTNDLPFDDRCEHIGCTGCQPCDWNGNPGICIDGVCVEYPCNDGVVCADGDLCTHDFCDYEDEMCVFNPRCRDNYCNTGHCDPSDGSCTYTPANDGASCGGYCVIGRPVCSGGECICLVGGVGAFEVQP